MDDLDEDDESGAAQRLPGAVAMGGALARPSWLSSPTLGRANRFLSTAAVSLMTPRRPLSQPEKVKVRTLAVEQRTEEDSEYSSLCYRTHWHQLLLRLKIRSRSMCRCVAPPAGSRRSGISFTGVMNSNTGNPHLLALRGAFRK
ncbi:E3 ubiquitin-protein ligase RNF123-like [Neolamprologus brichardi]|uniref:E3 ubiquitin-protein ligase RNF123-like n=1 Tax=Neolamprologus brichardi TaxID=32507 RepID=UPI0003EC5AC6|nr:E3 ubiquitin-protein ligase RNF123-like [Neolamprologus brichardi]